MRNSRSIQRLIFPARGAAIWPSISTVAVFAARFHRIVSGRRTSSLRLERGDAVARSASSSVGALLRIAWIC